MACRAVSPVIVSLQICPQNALGKACLIFSAPSIQTTSQIDGIHVKLQFVQLLANLEHFLSKNYKNQMDCTCLFPSLFRISACNNSRTKNFPCYLHSLLHLLNGDLPLYFNLFFRTAIANCENDRKVYLYVAIIFCSTAVAQTKKVAKKIHGRQRCQNMLG